MKLTDVFDSLDHEYMSSESSMALLCDSLQALTHMKSGSVDMVFADAPYNINKDFGNNRDTWESAEAYISWCERWIDECMRVLKPGGTIYVMAATQYMPRIDVYVSGKYNVLSRIIWAYDSSGVQARRMFGSLYEPILMANHSAKAGYVFNGADILVEAKTGAERGLIDYRKTPPAPYGTQKLPGNVWHFNRVRYRMPEYENHPTQKPEALLERIILASTNAGDIVLDPFSGSFTTSTVAVRLGRRAIGMELNDEYYEMGLRRTGIATHRNGEPLEKQKVRKTRAKSKSDHIKTKGE